MSQESLSELTSALKYLTAARKKARLFPEDHPVVVEGVTAFAAHLNPLLEKQQQITFSLIDKQLYVQGRLMASDSLTYGDFIEELAQRGVRSFSFELGFTLPELAGFIALTNQKPEDFQAAATWDTQLRNKGITRISVNRVVLLEPTASPSPEKAEEFDNARQTYVAALSVLRSVFESACARKKLNVQVAEQVIGQLASSIAADEDVLLSLTTMKSLHEYTFYHSLNVAILSMLMGMRLGLDTAFLNRFGLAALLHDIGKAQVPDAILDKPGGLSDDEWKIMQNHTLEGTRILCEQLSMNDLAVTVAAQHHIRYNLSGYPRFPELEHASLITNVVSVADTYDALTSDRSYRRAMLPDRALAIVLEGRGTHYHDGLVKVFTKLTGMFPVGTYVELDTGELGIVVRANPDDLCRPQVRLLLSSRLEGADPELIDLSDRTGDGHHRRTVLRAVDPEEKNLTPVALS